MLLAENGRNTSKTRVELLNVHMYNFAICKILIKRSDVRILKHDSHHTSENTQKPSYHRSTFIEREESHFQGFNICIYTSTPEFVR